MKTVVCVTPLPIEVDSRTMKVASSLSRLGYRSVVYEWTPSSRLPAALAFEVLTYGRPPSTNGAAPARGAEAAEAVPAAAAAAINAPEAEQATGPTPRRPSVVRALDDLAARAPQGLRRTVGRPWRGLLALYRGRSELRIFEVVRLWAYLRDYQQRCRRTAAELPPADAYYLTSYLQYPAVRRLASRHGARVIYDANDFYSVLWRDGRYFRPAERGLLHFYDLVEWVCARRAHACVTVSQGVAALARGRFRRPFHILRNAHDERLDERGVPDLRARLRLGEDTLLMAVSGNCKPTGMAIGNLLEALTTLPDHVHVAFLGRDYEAMRERASELGVADRAHFLEPVLPTEIVPVMAGADLSPILYWPATSNLRNALPNGFYHAVAAGLPLLFPRNLPEMREICERLGLGWEIDPESPASIADAVRRLDADRALLAARREHVGGVQDELSWAHDEPRLGALVARLIGEPAP
jgi:glycosyltransferase involved in cell wall biosynthesis